ncbi:FAD-dependent oxidoreductase [Mycolicibacterium sediminis]|uniref:Pentachlorophenol monooxygenase n=1 Tax=Mycolicibacterium sediminis TaxID=1286180 RepID=A0A7I7R0V8_9MYCO|nr:FAD-dependent oxidoreductase [Mycolicibacterium sediminis]BBY31857.1 pentachlorophenol monooxygenase [Mycolicibacterium sediminis]
MNDTDVLIVGAGPTGLTLAASLLHDGVRVTLIDRRAEGATTSRAAAVNARTLEVLGRIDVTRRLIKEGITAPRFTIRDGAAVLVPIDFSGLDTEHPYTLLIPQNVTERLLLERVRELGGDVVRDTTLLSFEEGRDGITATFDGWDAIRAAYLVGADGMHSTVREQAGIGFEGSSYEHAFVLADAVLHGDEPSDTPTDEVRLFWASEGLTVVAPLPDGTFRIVAPIDDAPEHPTTRFVQGLLDARGAGGVTVTDVTWGSRFRVHHRVADTYRKGRILLAGDAAHVHSPAGGQGMNLGIQDAVALGDALTRVLRGGPEALLDEYADARRPIAQQVIELTDRLTRLATLPRPLRPIRNVLLGILGRIPAARNGLAARLSGLVYR